LKERNEFNFLMIMNKLKMFIVCLAAVFSGNAMAQKVSAQDVTIEANGTADLVISLESSAVAAAAQLNVVLPEGIEVKYDADEEEYLFTKGEIVAKKKHVAVSKEADGSYQVLIQSGTDAVPFTQASGTLVTLPLVAGELATATVQGSVKNIKVADFNGGKMIDGDEVSFNITIAEPTAIKGLSAEESKTAEVYNLNGQRVSTARKGVFIVNGKKTVIK